MAPARLGKVSIRYIWTVLTLRKIAISSASTINVLYLSAARNTVVAG